MVPDWNNTQTIKEWWGSASRGPWGIYTIFTAPTDGYITVYDCNNTSDYYLNINGCPSNYDHTTVYHKCGTIKASNGFFMIAKGDFIVMNVHDDDTIKGDWSRTIMCFTPGKITE